MAHLLCHLSSFIDIFISSRVDEQLPKHLLELSEIHTFKRLYAILTACCTSAERLGQERPKFPALCICAGACFRASVLAALCNRTGGHVHERMQTLALCFYAQLLRRIATHKNFKHVRCAALYARTEGHMQGKSAIFCAWRLYERVHAREDALY